MENKDMTVRSYQVTLPYPPSANMYWRTKTIVGKKSGKPFTMTYLSGEAKAFKKEVAAQLAGLVPIEGSVILSMRFYRPRRVGDLDNRIKCLLDAIQGLLIHNDEQVVEIHAFRFDDKVRPRVDVELRKMGQLTLEPQREDRGVPQPKVRQRKTDVLHGREILIP